MSGKSYLLLMTLLYLPFSEVFGQFNNVWAFGTNAGIDFNGPTPVAITTNLMAEDPPDGFHEASASVCDQNGNLLFYTDGTTVWDRSHNVMPNGTSLAPPIPSATVGNATRSCAQGTLIVPFTTDSGKYYVFSLVALEGNQDGLFGNLYYSVVDIHLNGGLGDVVTGYKRILLDTGLTEHMATIPGNDCRSIWLVVFSRNTSEFKAFEIRANGINSSAVHSGPFAEIAVAPPIGCISISSDRTKMAVTGLPLDGTSSTFTGLALIDFNATTGEISNPKVIDTNLVYGVCFSPDNSKLYSNHPYSGIYQFDLSAGNTTNVINSKVLVFANPSPPFSSLARHLRLASNNKIYFNTGGMNGVASIDSPNHQGLACQLIDMAIPLNTGTSAQSGLPTLTVRPLPPDTITTYQIYSMDCFEELKTISASNYGNRFYYWNTGDTGINIEVSSPGLYWVTYQTPCEYFIDSIEVKRSGIPITLHSRASCIKNTNGAAWITEDEENVLDRLRYIWRAVGDTVSLSETDSLIQVPAGYYQVRIVAANCDTVINFEIPELDVAVSFESDTLVCQGDTIWFQNTSDSHFVQWLWQFDVFDSSTLEEPQFIFNDNGGYFSDGAYRVQLIGSGAICSDTAYGTIYVDAPSKAVFDVVPKEICQGQPVMLFPYWDSTMSQLDWDFGAEFQVESKVGQAFQHAFEDPGHHGIRMTTSYRACPELSYTDSVIVFPLPEVDLGQNRGICLHGEPVYLMNLREPPLDPYRQIWSTGDTADVLKVVHPGRYTLSVTTEPIGCTTTESIKITKDCYIDIPNAFTPDGDGHNDYFLPRQLLSKSLSSFSMQVFNRWGQLIFETNNLNGRGWDGRVNGKDQPVGVYLYKISLELGNGRRENYQGNVTLIR